jgi:transient receptor potential cation channel subfamily M protein 2
LNLGAALIATLVYKIKARKEKDRSYIEHADEFQNLAVQILERFYLTNPFECTQAIIREIPQFGNVTWLHLAVMAKAKLFIAERGVQDVLNDIWYRPFRNSTRSYVCFEIGMDILIIE